MTFCEIRQQEGGCAQCTNRWTGWEGGCSPERMAEVTARHQAPTAQEPPAPATPDAPVDGQRYRVRNIQEGIGIQLDNPWQVEHYMAPGFGWWPDSVHETEGQANIACAILLSADAAKRCPAEPQAPVDEPQAKPAPIRGIYRAKKDSALYAKRDEIEGQIQAIAKVPGNAMNYSTAHAITRNLEDLLQVVDEEIERRGLPLTK